MLFVRVVVLVGLRSSASELVEVEVDFGATHIYLGGVLIQVSMFHMRLSAAGRGYRYPHSRVGGGPAVV